MATTAERDRLCINTLCGAKLFWIRQSKTHINDPLEGSCAVAGQSYLSPTLDLYMCMGLRLRQSVGYRSCPAY